MPRNMKEDDRDGCFVGIPPVSQNKKNDRNSVWFGLPKSFGTNSVGNPMYGTERWLSFFRSVTGCDIFGLKV
jgi:hypothetical protein